MSFLNTDKFIVIQTRKGNEIKNFQNPEISEYNKKYFQPTESKYPKAKKRSEPTGLYNCHGLTFANRRCFVEIAKQVLMILEDDDYQEIEIRNVLPGDIIVYYSDGDVEHSGIVIQKAEAPLFIPLVFSKWSCHAEFIHYANYCPYYMGNIKYYRIIK